MSVAQDIYNNILVDRLDPNKVQPVRNVGSVSSLVGTQLPATLGVKTQALGLSSGLVQDKNTFAQLTAPGSTASFSMVGYKRATLAFVIAAINTSVTLRAEGTLDGTNWFNLSPTNTDSVFTANGVNAFNVEAAIDGIRLTMVAEVGGTAVTVDSVVRVSS